MSAPPLTHLKIAASLHCNLRCEHCVQGRLVEHAQRQPGGDFVSWLEPFLAEVVAAYPTVRVYLMGGEPLVGPWFFDVARCLRRVGLPYKTISNGLLLRRRLQELLEAPPTGLWLTFCGRGAAHDATVGRWGGYDELVANVRATLPRLRAAGVFVGAVLMVTRRSHGDLRAAAVEIAGLGFDEVVVQHLSFLDDDCLHRHQQAYRALFDRDSGFCFGEAATGEGIDPEVLADQLEAIASATFPCRVVVFPPIEGRASLRDYYGPAPRAWREQRCGRAASELCVLPDGAITACFGTEVGRLPQPLGALLAEGGAWADWRRRFLGLAEPLPGCARCHRLWMSPAGGCA